MANADHFYTVSGPERDKAYAFYGYVNEGTACFVPEQDSNKGVPFFRRYNPVTGDHFYTTSRPEADRAIAEFGYSDEGAACTVFETQEDGTTPLFRMYHPDSGDHFYTVSRQEADTAIIHYGYTDEGNACFVYQQGGPGRAPLYRLRFAAAVRPGAQSIPWAVLVTRFNDDGNDPSTVTLADLYAQWLNKNGAEWVAGNARPEIQNDRRTILELYRQFFTYAGSGTYNAVQYWLDMSQGLVDIGNSGIFPLKLDISSAEAQRKNQELLTNYDEHTAGALYWAYIFEHADASFSGQYGQDLHSFYAVAVSFQSSDGGAQGGGFGGFKGTNLDIRWIMNNGMSAWGQEMGHAFGLDHSRMQGSNNDYLDKWDTMSTWSPFALTPDPDYGARGIGINAWNMRCRSWLDERRVWRMPGNFDFSQTIELRPLHHRNLDGYLAAEIKGIGTDSSYLVELRVPEIWDAGIPQAAVVVHRFSGSEETGQVYSDNLIGQFLGTHSYVMPSTAGNLFLLPGDRFQSGYGPSAQLSVLSIDPEERKATVQLCYFANPKPDAGIKIVSKNIMRCFSGHVEGSEITLGYTLDHGLCMPGYRILWQVDGVTGTNTATNTESLFSFTVPPAGTQVTVTVNLLFNDGTSVSDSYIFFSVSAEQESLNFFICQLASERKILTPWWRWNPAEIRRLLPDYSPVENERIKTNLKEIVSVWNQLDQVVVL